MKKIRRSIRISGFTLVELLLSTILGGMVIASVTYVFANMAGSFAERPTTSHEFSWADANRDSNYIPYSPAYSQLPSAFNLQAEISREVQASSDDTYGPSRVFVITSDDGALPAIDYAPTTFSWMSSLTARALSASSKFRTLLQSNEAILTDSSMAGYSIFFVSGTNTVDMVVHVRRSDYTETVDGVANTTVSIYQVITYVNGTLATNLSYAYGIKNDTTNSPVYPSARHITLRTATNDWGIYDELGAQVIFPDPTVLPYQVSNKDTDDKIRTFSRFAALLPLNP